MVQDRVFAFSDRIDRSIRDFAATMGLEAQSGAQGAYSFKFQRSGTFTLTCIPHAERTIASLTFELERWNDEIPTRLFAIAQAEWQEGRLLRPGLSDRNEVVLAASIDDDVMSVQALDQCLQRLLAIRAGFD